MGIRGGLGPRLRPQPAAGAPALPPTPLVNRVAEGAEPGNGTDMQSYDATLHRGTAASRSGPPGRIVR